MPATPHPIPQEVTYAVYDRSECGTPYGDDPREWEKLMGPLDDEARARRWMADFYAEKDRKGRTKRAPGCLVIVRETITREYVAGHERDGA